MADLLTIGNTNPNQGAIFVGSSSAPQRTQLYAFVASILADLISFLI
jgi:hypothetical protein